MQKELTEGQTTNQLSTNNQINRHNKAKQQINNINMEKFAWRKCRKIFLEAIFSPKKKVSKLNFRRHFTRYHWLKKFPIFFQPITI